MEALQFGLPIIASNVGGIPEAVHHEVNGFLVEPCDYQDLAQKLEYLISNKDLRIKYGTQAKLFAQLFNNKKGVCSVINIYQQKI